MGGMDPRCCLLAQTERCFGKKPFCSLVLFSGAYFRALKLWLMEAFKAKCKSVFSRRGCFGCFMKPSLITAVDDPSQGLSVRDQKEKRSRLSDDFWSSSACEMEHSRIQSQRNMSLNIGSNLDPSSSTSQPSEFVNHGLLLWNQTRQQWLGDKKPDKRMNPQEPKINWNTIYEGLRGDYTPFPHPIPLPEMVTFLVDIWELEGS